MVQKKDLVDISDKDYNQRQGEYMQCRDCGESFGGTQGDYFYFDMHYAFECQKCGSENIVLVKDIITQKIIKE